MAARQRQRGDVMGDKNPKNAQKGKRQKQAQADAKERRRSDAIAASAPAERKK